MDARNPNSGKNQMSQKRNLKKKSQQKQLQTSRQPTPQLSSFPRPLGNPYMQYHPSFFHPYMYPPHNPSIQDLYSHEEPISQNLDGFPTWDDCAPGGVNSGNGVGSSSFNMYGDHSLATNMQTQDDDEDEYQGNNVDEEDVEENEEFTTTKQKRAAWSDDQDADLISGWSKYSGDPIRSTYQKSKNLWGNITSFVNENSKDKSCVRNITSCKNRWTKISKSVSKFVGAMTEAKNRAASGQGNIDVFTTANQIYFADMQKDFTLGFAYTLLKDCPKFLHMCTKINKEDIYSVEHGAETPNSEGSSKRSRVNETGGFSSSTNPDTQNSGDPSTPQYPTRPDGLKSTKSQMKGKGKKRLNSMQDMEAIQEQWKSSMSMMEKDHEKMDQWKEVKYREIQSNENIEHQRMEVERERIALEVKNKKFAILQMLLGKDSLTDEELAIKSKLYEELFQ